MCLEAVIRFCRSRRNLHSMAMYLLEARVELNVITSWLGHASLEATNHHAEIGMWRKVAAIQEHLPTTDANAPERTIGG